MEDFEYNGYYVMYFPHPKLVGKWEITDPKGDHIDRADTKKEAKKIVDDHINENLKNISEEAVKKFPNTLKKLED